MEKYCLLYTVIRENGKKSCKKWEILAQRDGFRQIFYTSFIENGKISTIFIHKHQKWNSILSGMDWTGLLKLKSPPLRFKSGQLFSPGINFLSFSPKFELLVLTFLTRFYRFSLVKHPKKPFFFRALRARGFNFSSFPLKNFRLVLT